MFFQTLFKQEKQEKLELHPADKLYILVRELLNKELPEHYSHHHILFTANRKLEVLNDSLSFHRSQINHHLRLGEYHLKALEQLRKLGSDLQTLVDGYMELSIDV